MLFIRPSVVIGLIIHQTQFPYLAEEFTQFPYLAELLAQLPDLAE
jgi:hypothetical protein